MVLQQLYLSGKRPRRGNDDFSARAVWADGVLGDWEGVEGVPVSGVVVRRIAGRK